LRLAVDGVAVRRGAHEVPVAAAQAGRTLRAEAENRVADFKDYGTGTSAGIEHEQEHLRED